MCGILGSINVNNSADYLDCIKHRGPDGSGRKSFAINNNTVELMHRRLSIIDLSEAGSQPMFSFNNKSCISFNGEIYNHLDLKEKLNHIPFKGHSDTETIINYFDQFDISRSLRDLNGIFAFAWLDLKNNILHLARDRFGIKPLYYYFGNNRLLFSSELRPLRACLHPAVQNDALMNSLSMRYTPSPSTIYQDIYKVEPGQLLSFSLTPEITLRKSYYVETPHSLGTRKDEYQKLVKEYGDLFEKAVEKQLMSDVEVGILLSGGVDSALVAAIAKQKSNTAVKAFTVGFEGDHDEIDEIAYAEQTADLLGLDHQIKKINFPDFLDSIEKIVGIVEEPIGTTSIVPMYYLSGLAASKVKVVLSGQGADEPLGGYNKYKALPWLEYSRPFKRLMPLTKFARFIYNKSEGARRLLTSMQSGDALGAYIGFNAISSNKEIADLMVPSARESYMGELLREQDQFKQIWKKRTPEKASIRNLFLYYDLHTSLADDLLMYTDKITMHFSLECRVPILDNDLMDFVESLDSRYKFNAKGGKIIHKDFARQYLPAGIIERKKLGFKSPTESWFKENRKDIENQLLANPEFKTYFDADAVKSVLARHSNGQNLEKQIFLLLSISYLLRNSSSKTICS